MSKKIKAALIDMDGILYDSMPNHARAWTRLMSEIGVDARLEEFFLFEGCTGAWVINYLFQRQFNREASDKEKADLYELKSKYFSEQPPVSIMPGAQELISRLRERNIQTILVTGSGQNSLLNRLETDFPEAFPEQKRVTSASVTHGKPHPEPYLKGLEMAGVSADEAIAIDNAPLGVKSAHAAGVFTIGVVTGPIDKKELHKEGADITFNSMIECADNILSLIDKIKNS